MRKSPTSAATKNAAARRMPSRAVVCQARASTRNPVAISIWPCRNRHTVMTASRLPSHAHKRPARRVGRIGGIHAVGPVFSLNGLENPSPATIDWAMLRYSPPRCRFMFALLYGLKGGKYLKLTRSVTANDKLAYTEHPITTSKTAKTARVGITRMRNGAGAAGSGAAPIGG